MIIRVLGPVDVVIEGHELAVPRFIHRIILALLGISPNVTVSSEALIEAIWHEEPTERRLKNLHAQIYQLRRLINRCETSMAISGDGVVTRPSGYAFSTVGNLTDAEIFCSSIGNARAAAGNGKFELASSLYDSALTQWRGQAFGDVADSSTGLHVAALQFEEQRNMAQEERIEAALAIGQERLIMTDLIGLAAAQPLRERLQELLMVALYRCGRRADALDVYLNIRRKLTKELGIEPSRALRDLQGKILIGEDDVRLVPHSRVMNGLTRDRTAGLPT